MPSIDPLADELLTLPQAAALFPCRRAGSKVSTTTLWRWYSRGSRGVRLEVARVGGQVYTTRDAIRDFIQARSVAGGAAVPQTPSPSTRSKRAMKELERMGM
jgi:hypothetical protein